MQEGQFPDQVKLPHTQPSWAASKLLLERVAAGEMQSREAFEAWADEATVPCWGVRAGSSKAVQSYFLNENFTLLTVPVMQESQFYSELLPFIAQQALLVEEVFVGPIESLKRNREGEIVLTKQQSCALLAAFFLGQTDLQHFFIHVM